MTAELEWLRREGSREICAPPWPTRSPPPASSATACGGAAPRPSWEGCAGLPTCSSTACPTREARTLDRLLGELAELATRAPAGGPIRMWLDDDLVGGTPPDPTWLQVTTAHEAIALLVTGRVTELSLDHDLGDERRAGTGYDVVTWLAGRGEAAGHDLWPRSTLAVHSANGAATPGIERVVDRCAPLERVPGHPRRWRRRAR